MALTKYERGVIYLLKQISSKLDEVTSGNYSVKGAAKYLGISVSTLQALRKSGDIRAILLTKSDSRRRRIAYRRAELDRFMRAAQEKTIKDTGGKDLFQDER